MRKIRAALAAVGMTVTAGALLAGPAEAAPDGVRATTCAAEYRAHQGDGYMRVYDSTNCNGYLDAAAGNDNNWNDTVGPIERHANDRATSLLNTGTYAGGINNVQFWDNANRTGGTGCLAYGELYVDDLRDNRFVDRKGNFTEIANNQISSHDWRAGCTNPWT